MTDLDACPIGATRFTDARLLVWVVLFGSVLDAGPDAIAARAQEWRELFGRRR